MYQINLIFTHLGEFWILILSWGNINKLISMNALWMIILYLKVSVCSLTVLINSFLHASFIGVGLEYLIGSEFW
jgi:hypothetical protein